MPLSILEKYDTPILAGTLKLWLLELDPPLALWEGWDEIRKLYPSGKSLDILYNQALIESACSRCGLSKGPPYCGRIATNSGTLAHGSPSSIGCGCEPFERV